MNSRCFGKKPSQGFTLIELMIAIAIIAILAGIAVPAFMAWKPNYQLRRAARDLYSNMQKAKMEAIKRNVNVVLTFTLPSTYSAADSGANIVIPPVNLNNYGNGIQFGMPNAAGILGADPGTGALPITYAGRIFTFNARGLVPAPAVGGTTGCVYIRNNDGNGFAVGVLTAAGIVVMRKWFPNSNNWQ